MKRVLLTLVILQALFAATVFASVPEAQSEKPAAAVVAETIKLTPEGEQNWRHPGVAEDSRGNRLVIFRGPEGSKYYYVYCPKNGTWSAPAIIANGDQPLLDNSLYAQIVVDSYDRFHCTWEDADAQVYATFKDGVWTTPMKIEVWGRYDLISSALGVRSDDSIVTAHCAVQGYSKEIHMQSKGKNDAYFSDPFNVTRDDKEGSTQPCIAIDKNDNTWMVWKSDLLLPDVDENLVIYLAAYDRDFRDVGDWIRLSSSPAWSFVPQIAINSEGRIMTTWAFPSGGNYSSRYYDPATETLSEQILLGTGMVLAPWHTFFHRLVSHDKDFYSAVTVPGRSVPVMKFNADTSKWEEIYRLPEGVEMLGMYAGYDKLLIAWNNWIEPTGVYLTTIGISPWMKIRIRSVSNLDVENRVIERSFFKSYHLNTLTWTANPENTDKGITVTAHRIYRKNRADDDTQWTKIAEVAGTVFSYNDRYVASDNDFVYSVTCVDAQDHESKIF